MVRPRDRSELRRVAGQIVELGRPRDLLDGTAGSGHFRKLVDESADGEALYAALDIKRPE